MEKIKKSIIWNLTRQCNWNCKFCCVSAIHKNNGFQQVNIEKDPFFKVGNELNYKEKKMILDLLKNENVKIDFSGGELLIDPLNLSLIVYASSILGKENIGISVSGLFINEKIIETLKNKINDVEITLDYIPYEPYPTRPIGYHEYAANAMINFKKSGFYVGAQTVLTKCNIEKEKIKNLYDWLVLNKIDEWSLLRYFPSGRGRKFPELTPTFEEYQEVIDYIKVLNKSKDLEVHFQYLLPNHENYTLACRAVKKSIGILPDGQVTACFWCLDDKMNIERNEFRLGKFPEQTYQEIINSENSKNWIKHNYNCIFFSHETLER